MLMLLATINVVDKLDKILYALMEKGIKNATILDSTNMRHALTHNDEAVWHFTSTSPSRKGRVSNTYLCW